jgi:hypothetical protein
VELRQLQRHAHLVPRSVTADNFARTEQFSKGLQKTTVRENDTRLEQDINRELDLITSALYMKLKRNAP